MNVNEVIKYPILSEKTYAQMANNVYTFAVDKRTNKAEVKKTIEFIFDVKVESVNIMNIDKKPAKLGRFAGFKAGYKKAIVKLADGQINIFPDETVKQVEENIKETKKVKKEAKAEISEAEKKAAAKIAAKAEKKSLADKVIDKTEEIVENAKEETNKALNDTQEVLEETISKKGSDKESEK